MDRISELSDELLIKILSLLPTKAAVSTSILSKRWQYLWLWLPKLKFVFGRGTSPKNMRLSRFLDRNLPLHRAPVIESFCLKLEDSHFEPERAENVKTWIGIAVSRRVRELEIDGGTYGEKPNILPSNLYTCKSLVILKLRGGILLDVPQIVSLPSLKTLKLDSLRYANEESPQRLLSSCPILEDLTVDLGESNIAGKFTIDVPSLLRLSLKLVPERFHINVISIKTPSLKYFKLVNYVWGAGLGQGDLDLLIETMPNLVEASLDTAINDDVIRPIMHVKRLSICSPHMYRASLVFDQLEHLKFCRCRSESLDLLIPLLELTPNLQVLDLSLIDDHHFLEGLIWSGSRTVPECMLSSLHTVSWSMYIGDIVEKGLADYILKHAVNLKTATFESFETDLTKFEMLKDLALSSRASTTCELVLN